MEWKITSLKYIFILVSLPVDTETKNPWGGGLKRRGGGMMKREQYYLNCIFHLGTQVPNDMLRRQYVVSKIKISAF